MNVLHCQIGPKHARDGRPAIAWVRVSAGFVAAACRVHAVDYELVEPINEHKCHAMALTGGLE